MFIAKCGCDCFNCPSYKKNLRTIEDRQQCSSAWKEFLNIKLSPEKLRVCDGCSIPDRERENYYVNCRIRKCAMLNEMENCAFCTGFPCNELLKAHSIQKINNRDEFIKQTGKEISESDYRLFIEPYTGLHHLNKMRQTLSDRDYKDFKKFTVKTKFAQFDNFGNNQEALKKIYMLLTSICIEENISYARLLTIEPGREQILKILWVMGRFGNFSKDGSYIELDSKIFMTQKIHGMYNTLLGYLNDLKKHNIHCEIVPLVAKGWLTPLGGLRKEGWLFRLKFEDSGRGAETLKVFKDYVHKLDTKFGNKAFKLFKLADLSV